MEKLNLEILKEFGEIWKSTLFSTDIDRFEQRDLARHRILDLLSSLEKKEYLLGAGMIAHYSISLFFGEFENMALFGNLAIKYLEAGIQRLSNPFELAIAHLECASVYRQFQFPYSEQSSNLHTQYIFHRRAAAKLLANDFVDHDNKEKFMVSGLNYSTNFIDVWGLEFVDYEVNEGLRFHNENGWVVAIPGAFQIYISIADYERALEIATKVPEGFIYPGVNGWKEACMGFVAKSDAHDHYLKAAEIFGSDLHPEEGAPRTKPYWSAYNSGTLAPYFRARAALSVPHSNPDELIDAIKIASNEIHPNQSGFVHIPAIKLAILIHGLGTFLETHDETVLDDLAKNYQKEIDRWGQLSEDDELLLHGLKMIKNAIEGFRYDPVKEITSGNLFQGIQILEKIPEWSQYQFVIKLADPIGKTTLEISQGTTYGDIVEILETIVDERILQQLVLELLRADAPYHAKITHGPIEFGKDILAIMDDFGTPKLHLYAMKAGDIDARKWPSVKESIDQMFTILISNPIVTQYEPVSVHGFLVFNGHFNQHIDPVANAWFDELCSERNWDLKVIDIDGLSKWIVSKRLVSVLQKFMKEQRKTPKLQ
jgi:hypothetical protein